MTDNVPDKMTIGEYCAAFLADRFASWYFLIGALIFLNVWVVLNSFGIITLDKDWGKADLVLSQLTYLVDIVIIMRQITQGKSDRQQMNKLIELENQILFMEKNHAEKLDRVIKMLDNKKRSPDGRFKA